jgi:hypothetical protein
MPTYPVSNRWINTVPPEDDPYWERVRFVAEQIGSDGCSFVKDWFLDSCREHDIHWRTGATLDGAAITTRQSNTRFRLVIQSRSKFGVFSPLSWWRWAGVSLGGIFIDHKST